MTTNRNDLSIISDDYLYIHQQYYKTLDKSSIGICEFLHSEDVFSKDEDGCVGDGVVSILTELACSLRLDSD